MTETEFIQWIRDNKDLDISQSGNFSTLGSLGELYETKEGFQLFYGLSMGGFPPHLSLTHLITHVLDLNQDADVAYRFPGIGYAEVMRSFYSNDLTNEDRYEILLQNEALIIDVTEYETT